MEITQPEKPIRYTAIKGDYFKCRKVGDSWNRPVCNSCGNTVRVNDEYYRHIKTKGLRRDSWQYRSMLRNLHSQQYNPVMCKDCYADMPNNQQREVIH